MTSAIKLRPVELPVTDCGASLPPFIPANQDTNPALNSTENFTTKNGEREITPTLCAEWLSEKLRGLTEKQVAAAADIGIPTARAIKDGKMAPAMATMTRLFRSLPGLRIAYERELLGIVKSISPAYELAQEALTAAHLADVEKARRAVAAEKE